MGRTRASGSLQGRFSIAVSVLLLAVLAVFSLVAYRTVRNSLIQAAEVRLGVAADQLASILEESAATETAAQQTLLARSEIAEFLDDPGPSTEASARDLLAILVASVPSRIGITLRSADGASLTVGEADVLEPGDVEDGFGPFEFEGGRVTYPVSSVRPGPEGPRILSERLQLNGNGGQRARDLIGQDARVLLGTPSSDVWTDLTGPTDAPSHSDGAAGLLSHRAGGREAWGLQRAVEGTPWAVWVGLPASVILAPLTSFIRVLGGAVLILVLLGSLGALAVARRVTRPLVDLTEAAEAIAAGDYSRRVATDRTDEIGRLASAFDTMSESVEEREEALRASEKRLRTLLETVNLAVLVLDSRGKIEYANPYLLELTGYSRDEAVGQDVFEVLVSEEDRPELQNLFKELIEEDLHTRRAAAIITKDGEKRLISWHNTVLRDSDNRPVGSLNVGEDITERARLEEQLHVAQKMEAVGRLAGGIAHDFNNLLTAILGPAELCLLDLDPDHPMRNDLEEIKSAAERAAGLTGQLLAFARRQVLQPRAVDLNTLIDDVERLLHRVIGEDIELQSILEPDLGVVEADPSQLEQVIMNLAINARDAMPQGGMLTIETSNVELDEAYGDAKLPFTPGPHVVLAVSDTGIGMDAETRAKIFEPFFTTKEESKGTGLGLPTVYGIVKQSGGNIWVYSEEGEGTVFKIYLPRVDKPSEETEAGREVPADLTGDETILVVEDEPSVRAVTQRMLEARGYRVLCAESAQEALETARNLDGALHLLITDVVMPEASGRDLEAGLKELRPETKVLFVSGYTDDTIVRHGVLHQGVHFLQKPFTSDVLARKVRQTLDGKRASPDGEGARRPHSLSEAGTPLS